LIASLALVGCGTGRIVATNSDEAARAAGTAMRQQADEAARSAPVLGSALDAAVARQKVATASAEAVQSSQWRQFKAQFTAKVRVTRESEVCQPVVDLVFAKDVEDVVDALRSLSSEASQTTDAEELYADVNDLVAIWEDYDPEQTEKTYIAVSTALFQDFYCID
jgi:hypothetical protein